MTGLYIVIPLLFEVRILNCNILADVHGAEMGHTGLF